MAEMPEVLMPDQSAPTYPAEFRFSPAVEDYYRKLPRTLRRNWDLFGSDSVAEVPQKAAVRGVEGTARAHIKSYEELATQLGHRFRDLQEGDRRLADQVRRSLIAAREGRADIEAAIHRINGDAATVPIGQSKGEHILRYLSAGLDRVDQIVQDVTKSLSTQAASIDRLAGHLNEPARRPAPTAIMPEQPRTGRAPVAGNDGTQGRMEMPGGVDNSGPHSRRDTATAQPSATPQVTGSAAHLAPETIPWQVNSGESDQTPPSAGSNVVGTAAGPPGHTSSTAANDSASGSAGGVSGGEQAAGKRATAPTPAATARTQTPWSDQAGVGPWARQHNVPSSGKRSGVGASSRSRKRSTEELVVYVFPDGRRQEVSPMIAQVLDAAFDDRPSTHARSAYTSPKTTVSVDDAVEIQELSSAVTGDVAVWARRSAVLVVFGAGRGRILEVIVDGRLRPFSTRMDSKQGGFGPFTGLRRQRRAGLETGHVGAQGTGSELRAVSQARGSDTKTSAATVKAQRLDVPPTRREMNEKSPTDHGDPVVVADR
ncbi:hypothetical protein [Nocardia sp. NPDC024068]|uniref:hypothetical protein n=1 Tax=Nocardia sp. NPDC024068 TaxID=3157197 RepID=UPI00340BDE14